MNGVSEKLGIIKWLINLEDQAILQKIIDLKQATGEEGMKENRDA